MRDVKVIEAEIAKLKAELEDVKSYEHKRTSAVHILKNLGWTFSKKNGWRKPITIEPTPFDADTMTHVKAGDWVYVTTPIYTGYAYVRKVHGKVITISRVIDVNFACANVSDKTITILSHECKIVPSSVVVRDFHK